MGALSDFAATLLSNFSWSASKANGDNFQDTSYIDLLKISQALDFGTASEEANRIFVDTRTVTLATGTDDIDLAGSLIDPFGNTITFSTIKAIFIYNRATVRTEKLRVGAASAHCFTGPYGASSATKPTIYPGGVHQITAPFEGYPVEAGTSDILRIRHAGSVGDITYDIVIIGNDNT
jgi:hypothetical protein